jgi:exo-1,4-beta-D-glucosaminidase
MTALNYLAKAPLEVSATRTGDRDIAIRLHNPGKQIAFFERAEITDTADGDEILPIEYTDNYVTVFPGETVDLRGTVIARGDRGNFVRVTGYNTAPVVVPVE